MIDIQREIDPEDIYMSVVGGIINLDEQLQMIREGWPHIKRFHFCDDLKRGHVPVDPSVSYPSTYDFITDTLDALLEGLGLSPEDFDADEFFGKIEFDEE